MERLNFHPSVKHKLSELVEILFKEDYFSFQDSAIAYVAALEAFANTIPEQKNDSVKIPVMGCGIVNSSQTEKPHGFLPSIQMENIT